MTRSSSSIIFVIAGGVLVGAVLAGCLPAAAQAPCTQWNVSGHWVVGQSNAQPTEIFMMQKGTELRGDATAGGWNRAHGPIDGVVDGDRITFTIDWSGGAVGVYSGRIDPTGRIEGTTHDRRSGARASWYSHGTMNCLAREAAAPPPAAPPPAPGKPVWRLGKKKIKKIGPNPLEVLKANDGIADVLKTSPVPDSARPPTQNTATVNGDVDLYDAPGGEGNVIGILKKGRKVTLAGPGCHAVTWCRIAEGFVWGSFLTL